jgi:hypothetical protein
MNNIKRVFAPKKQFISFLVFSISSVFIGCFIYNYHYKQQSNFCIAYSDLTKKEKIVDEKLKNYVRLYMETKPFEVEKFSLQKAQTIKNTDLYKMVNLMPKGSNLHLHYLSNLSAENTFTFCYNNPYVYINPEQTGDLEMSTLYK